MKYISETSEEIIKVSKQVLPKSTFNTVFLEEPNSIYFYKPDADYTVTSLKSSHITNKSKKHFYVSIVIGLLNLSTILGLSFLYFTEAFSLLFFISILLSFLLAYSAILLNVLKTSYQEVVYTLILKDKELKEIQFKQEHKEEFYTPDRIK